ncbi:MAG: helix-turn-helix domain-containing protein, partial [Herbiconiux sp.]|nr:helix-turn-helix domain-containing protein [Herbiconiux sp.]
LVRLNAQRPLALALLQLFPWFGLDLPPDLRRPSSARLRTALEYLQHHAHEAITPADAARAAGMHTRTLQQATRSHLGVSPSEYLRGVRLDRARHDLTEGMPGSQTVAAIAHDWGFGHLGRFSAFYRGRFGERPGDTLRR